MDAVMHSKELQEILNRFVVVKLDIMSHETKELQVKAVPVLIFFSSLGNEISRQEGSMSTSQLSNLLNKFLSKQ